MTETPAMEPVAEEAKPTAHLCGPYGVMLRSDIEEWSEPTRSWGLSKPPLYAPGTNPALTAALARVEALERALVTAAEDERDRLYASWESCEHYSLTPRGFFTTAHGAMLPAARAALRASTLPGGGGR